MTTTAPVRPSGPVAGPGRLRREALDGLVPQGEQRLHLRAGVRVHHADRLMDALDPDEDADELVARAQLADGLLVALDEHEPREVTALRVEGDGLETLDAALLLELLQELQRAGEDVAARLLTAGDERSPADEQCRLGHRVLLSGRRLWSNRRGSMPRRRAARGPPAACAARARSAGGGAVLGDAAAGSGVGELPAQLVVFVAAP